MPITNQNELINARTNKRQTLSARRLSITNGVAGTSYSIYRAGSTTATYPQPVIPTVNELPTKTSSWNFNNATGIDKNYIDVLSGGMTNAQRLVFYDRLYHMGGLNGTLITAQTVNSTITFPFRGNQAAECEWFLEFYSDTGGTQVTANVAVTYTDTTTSVIPVIIPATCRAGRLLLIIPVQGKIISSIQSVTLLATTGAAGNFGVTCGDRISVSMETQVANIPMPPKNAILREIPNDFCLWGVVECSTNSTADIAFELTLIQG